MVKENQSEWLANYYAGYLFEKYKGNRHVRRVSTWIGFLLKAIEHLPGVSFSKRRARQVGFVYKSRQFKARFNHHAGRRGGIDIVEVLLGRGSPEGEVVVSITSLDEAEDAYSNLQKALDRFIK